MSYDVLCTRTRTSADDQVSLCPRLLCCYVESGFMRL